VSIYPDHWIQATLGDVVQPRATRVTPTPEDERPYLSMEHVEPGTTKVVGHGRAGDMTSACMEFEPGDVLYGRLRPYLNKVCRPTFAGLASAEFITFRDFDGVEPAFLKYTLNQPDFVAFANQVNEGDRPRVKWSQIRSFPLTLPPLDEQQRIVEAIEEHFSRLDAGVESLHRAKRNLARLRVSILRAGVEGHLTASDPKTWERRSIDQIGRVGSGATPKRGKSGYWVGGTIPWVTSGQLNDPLVTEPADYITERAIQETSVQLWPVGTILVAMYGEGKTRGKCSELAFPSTTNQACAAIVLNEEYAEMRPFLKLVLTARYEENRRLASGGVQPNLSLGLIKSIEVPIPERAVQCRIVEEADRLLSVVESLEKTITLGMIRSDGLKRAILREAFNGGLVLAAS